MKKELNYNYAFLFYDVGEKRVQKVFKICKKYLSHFQKSVFRGDMTPSKFIQLRKELKQIIDEDEDFICIIKLMNDNVFGEEILGNSGGPTGEDLMIWRYSVVKIYADIILTGALVQGKCIIPDYISGTAFIFRMVILEYWKQRRLFGF